MAQLFPDRPFGPGGVAAALAPLLLGWLASAPAQEAPPPPPPAPAPAPGATYDLTPLYRVGDRVEVEARLSIVLQVRLVVAAAGIDRTSEQEQASLRRYRDELTEVRDGHVAEVRRRFLEAWDGEREPGAHALARALHPLHQRRIVVGLDREGRRVVRVPEGDPPLAEDAADQELHTERYEAVLPREPVAVGARWVVDEERMQRALGPALSGAAVGRPAGRIECELREVRDEALDPGAEPERYAVVALAIEASGHTESDGEDEALFGTSLRGTVRFSLRRRKVVTVDLEGTARLRQTRRDGEAVLELEGHGPVELHKRMWFPERPVDAPGR